MRDGKEVTASRKITVGMSARIRSERVFASKTRLKR
jgi:hypothetical protein